MIVNFIYVTVLANVSFSKVALPLAIREPIQAYKLNLTSLHNVTILLKQEANYTSKMVMLVKSSGTKNPPWLCVG